jgi:hypothetical protein
MESLATFSTIRVMVRLLINVAELLRMSKVWSSRLLRIRNGVLGYVRNLAFSKGGYEVVWEKFGRRAESLARSDPAGSF